MPHSGTLNCFFRLLVKVRSCFSTDNSTDPISVIITASCYGQYHGYVGMERADLLIPGCAILQAVIEFFPQIRLRVADRGVREGIIHELLINNFGSKKHK